MESETITSDQLKKKLEDGDKVYVLDVRDPEKYQIGTFVYPGVVAENIPFVSMVDENGGNRELERLPIGTEIITICTSGNKAGKAASFLRERGFNANALQGGLTTWQEKR